MERISDVMRLRNSNQFEILIPFQQFAINERRQLVSSQLFTRQALCDQPANRLLIYLSQTIANSKQVERVRKDMVKRYCLQILTFSKKIDRRREVERERGRCRMVGGGAVKEGRDEYLHIIVMLSCFFKQLTMQQNIDFLFFHSVLCNMYGSSP